MIIDQLSRSAWGAGKRLTCTQDEPRNERQARRTPCWAHARSVLPAPAQKLVYFDKGSVRQEMNDGFHSS